MSSSLSEIIELFKFLQNKQIHLTPKSKVGYTQVVEWDYNKSAYDFYNVIIILSSYIDVGMIQFIDDSMIINGMNANRQILLSLVLENIEVKNEIKIGISFNDLKYVLKSKAKGNKRLKLEVKANMEKDYENGIMVHKILEETEKPIIVKTFLRELDKDLGDIPLDNLKNIVYDTTFGITKSQLNNVFSEFGKKGGSSIVNIVVNKNGVSFKEEGNAYSSTLEFKSDELSSFEFKSEESEVKSPQNKHYIIQLKKIFPLLDKDDLILISLKNDHPLKIELISGYASYPEFRIVDNLDLSLLIYIYTTYDDTTYDDTTYDDDEL